MRHCVEVHSRSADLFLLPPDLAGSARVLPNGEVEWPREVAVDAVLALTAAGCLVLGADLRRYEDAGVMEMAWRDVGQETDPVAGGGIVESALGRHDPSVADFKRVLITWASA